MISDIDILNNLTRDELKVIKFIKEVCIKINANMYLVGGVIRDIDICVQCNLIDIIENLTYIKEYKYHERFHTSTILFENEV
ncbi:hypothetical protein ADU90_04750 [Clostridium botulinum]|uniref:Poly A polymerase head domain-containing protein n=1 Tax=Clostridium botulinum C/D str. DC5 TaxID=1443128 RepID=A0A0A0IKE4_CLOBO|nr:hypothetical protein [Clostridium botulinum]KEI07079.1 hypothetical protein Z952_02255 [Clostridium botulinum C/D str. BKT75002]KEI12156.1 hypothetical protein Z954_06400 [Clostridium botulinum C/D str. BKT2873]KGM96841.1 hypothetical protein Z956_02110 [Clostridium botulinum D str. CCUG 7971]KGN01945.1 hypothetical protein Z955_00665 [Clostridium botulinum C/D str. DC5]KOC48582.1 hypothetical protein ADU88_08200 [Clostridium botulinum]